MSGCRAALLALAALPLLAACAPAAPPPARLVPSFAVMTVKAGAVPVSATLSGDIEAQVEQQLSFRASGRIIDLAVDVGDHVSKGQVLGHLDPQELQASADLAAASVVSAQAQVTQAQADLDRDNALFAQGNTTRAALDAAQTGLSTAEAGLKAAEAQAASARSAVGYAALTASADGVVLSRPTDVGQVVQAAQPVFTLALDGARDAVFQVYDRGLIGVPPGVSVALSPLADPGVRATGHVREFSPTLDTATGTVRVKVGLDPGSPDMPLGTAVNGTVPLPPLEGDALPWSALFRDARGPAVWAVAADDTVSLQPVTVERFLDDKVVVSAGLRDGERIVARGLQLLRPGEKIRPVAEAGR